MAAGIRALAVALLCALGWPDVATLAEGPPATPLAASFDAPAGEAPAGWRAILFSGRSATRYTVAAESDATPETAPAGARGLLRAEAHQAGSMLMWDREFDPKLLPLLRWRWKISGTLRDGDLREKAREDLPARVLVVFPFEPDAVGLWERLMYEVLRLRHGEYPPGEALVYAWANQVAAGRWSVSSHSPRVHIYSVESGDDHAGQWRSAMRDIAEDYAARFGRPVPRRARIAVMVDTDDTGATTVSWFDDIQLHPAPALADRVPH